MYTLFSAQKRALTKISRKKKDFNESNVEHAFKAQQCRYSVWLLHTVFPIFLHFLFGGLGGGGLESFARLSTYTPDIPTELYFSHWISLTCFISSSNSLNVRFPPATSVPR